MSLYPEIRKLLCKIALLPSADVIVVFGSVATGQKVAADLDVCLGAEDCDDWSSEIGLRYADSAKDLLKLAYAYYGWLDPFVQTRSSLNVRNDHATGWMRAKNAKALTAAIRDHGVPIKTVISRHLRGQSFLKDIEMDEHKTALWRMKWEQNAADKVESFTMSDAKEIVSVILDELNIAEVSWEPSIEAISPWEYMRFELGSQKLSVGVSSGGVVSVNGRPHAPDDLACNITLDAARRSLRGAVTEYLHVLIMKTDTAAFLDIGHAEEATRIVRELADGVRSLGVVPGLHFPLKDANGNEVGVVAHSYDHYPPLDGALVRVSLRAKGWDANDVALLLEQAASNIERNELSLGLLKSDNEKMSGVLAVGDFHRAQPEEQRNENSASLDAS